MARDKEGFALATRTLAGINQCEGQIAMEYGRYDETARYFRRMEELSEELAAADPDELEPLKVKATVKATLGDFRMDRIGDAEAALKHFDQALGLRRQWLTREPSNDDAKRGVANILGAIACARLKLGDPARARDMYREEVELRDQLTPAAAEQVEARRERAGLRDKLGDLSVSPRRPEGRSRALPAGTRAPPGDRRPESRREPGPPRRAAVAGEAGQPRAHLFPRTEGRPPLLPARPSTASSSGSRPRRRRSWPGWTSPWRITMSPRPNSARGIATRR